MAQEVDYKMSAVGGTAKTIMKDAEFSELYRVAFWLCLSAFFIFLGTGRNFKHDVAGDHVVAVQERIGISTLTYGRRLRI